ncbi:MAG TPA: SCP2 sterol-binding domain-containing protein [Anaerolineales bacterium]|nr:SCP2 sterol-binding domain-containing protein [Anaerolineales bacterium]
MNTTFNPQTLSGDLTEVHRIYSRFFATLDESNWDKPVKGSPKEWTLHETIAHLVALNGAGLESVKHTLRGEPYIFIGLEDRYKLNAYNRKGIDNLLDIPMKELCARFLDIHNEAARIAHDLRPDQAELTSFMSIYNRPVSIVEGLSILSFHAGVIHAAQVAEPAGLPPLWEQLSPGFRQRTIERVMRVFSLLYRRDIGGSLRATLVFRVDGPGGGEWYVKLSPDAPTSGEGVVEHPNLTIHLRETAVFCQMLTGRFDLPAGLISGRMKLRGDLRLFLRMDTLFSVDVRPKVAANEKTLSTSQRPAGSSSN